MQLPSGLKGQRRKYLIIDSQAYSDAVFGLIDMTLTGVDFSLDEAQYRILDVTPYYNTELKDMGDIWLLVVVERSRIDVKYSIKKWKESVDYQSLIRGNKLDELIDEEK